MKSSVSRRLFLGHTIALLVPYLPGWEMPGRRIVHPFMCPPCGCAMDGREFDGPGRCPACGMELVPAPGALLTVEQMREDLRFLHQKILTQHPNPFLYIPDRVLQERFRHALESLAVPLDRIAFYRIVAPVAAALRDGHTLVTPPLDAFREYARSAGVFAMDVQFIEGRLFVGGDRSGAGLSPGTEITAIDGRSVPELVADLRGLINDVHPLYAIYERLFRELLWLRYGPAERFALEIVADGARSSVLVPARLLAVEEVAPAAPGSPYRLETLPEHIGLLSIESFAPSPEYGLFLEESFATLRDRGVDALIIDLRRNGGGSGRLAQQLMSYLTDRPYTLIDGFIVRVTEDLQALYRRGDTHTDIETRNIVLNSSLGSLVNALADSGPVIVTPEPRSHVFRGAVYVLTGNNTLSAAAMFTAMAKCNGVAEIVGAEPGQTTKFLADALPLTMPHSHLAFTVSFSEIHMPCEQSYDRGIQPDYDVEPTPADLMDGRDSVLRVAVDLIVSRRQG